MKKIIIAILIILITKSNQSIANAQYQGGFYPIYNKEKLYAIEGKFKRFALSRASGGVTIEVNGEEKFYESSKFLTIEKRLNKCLDSPVPEFNITCKTWPKNITTNTLVRITYWIMTPPGMHEDGIVVDITVVKH